LVLFQDMLKISDEIRSFDVNIRIDDLELEELDEYEVDLEAACEPQTQEGSLCENPRLTAPAEAFQDDEQKEAEEPQALLHDSLNFCYDGQGSE